MTRLIIPNDISKYIFLSPLVTTPIKRNKTSFLSNGCRKSQSYDFWFSVEEKQVTGTTFSPKSESNKPNFD